MNHAIDMNMMPVRCRLAVAANPHQAKTGDMKGKQSGDEHQHCSIHTSCQHGRFFEFVDVVWSMEIIPLPVPIPVSGSHHVGQRAVTVAWCVRTIALSTGPSGRGAHI
jgi:hypothetical protein